MADSLGREKVMRVEWECGHYMEIWWSLLNSSWCGYMSDENDNPISGTYVKDCRCHHKLCREIVGEFNYLYSGLFEVVEV